jgi:hypothetical protein
MTNASGRLRGQVAVPEAGDGVYLHFKAADLLAMQLQFGDDWMMTAHDRLNKFDMIFLMGCLKHGGKKEGESFKIELDEVEGPIKDLVQKVLDCLFLSMHGKTHIEYMDDFYKQVADAADKANEKLKKRRAEEEEDDPSRPGPEVISSASSAQPSGQD